MEPRKVALGSVLLFVSCLTLLETGTVADRATISIVAAGALALAVGSLFADTARQDRTA